MRILWSVVWAFLLSFMISYVLSNMAGQSFDIVQVVVLALIFSVSIIILGEGALKERRTE